MIINPFAHSRDARVGALNSGEFDVDWDADQAQGLVGFWPLGIFGGNAKDYDYSGNHNHGTRTNGPIVKAVNHPRWGGVHVLDFDGSNDHVDLGTRTYLSTTAPFTVAAWVKLNSFPTEFPGIILLKTDVTQNWRLLYSNQVSYQPIAFGAESDWGNFRSDNTGVDGTTGQWEHIVVTYNGASATTIGNYSMHLDGDILGLTTSGSYFPDTGNSKIGTHVSSNEWDGQMHDIRIYDRAQLASLIREIYDEPWRIIYPLGVRTISFAPAEAVTISLPPINLSRRRFQVLLGM